MTNFRHIWLPLSQVLHKLKHKVKESGVNKINGQGGEESSYHEANQEQACKPWLSLKAHFAENLWKRHWQMMKIVTWVPKNEMT